MKNTDEEMANEIKNQIPLLQNLENLIDKVNGRIKKVSGNFNVYLERSSNSCLMTALCIQVAILILIVLLL